jgi:Bacitracin resistance protein BacA
VLNFYIDVDIQVAQKASGNRMSHLTYAEAMVIGLIQGPPSCSPSPAWASVLIPALVGGSWAQDLSVSRPESPYLAFIVGLHVATAAAMIIYFRHDWARIVTGFVSLLRDRTIATAEQKLAWMIVLATIPVGLPATRPSRQGATPPHRCPACGNSPSSSRRTAPGRPRTGGWPGWATARPS